MYWLEFDTDVLSYGAPGIVVNYQSNGKEKTHTPDFQVVRYQKKQIIEVKSQKTVESEKYDHLYHMLSGLYDETGWTFVVLTEAEIRREPILSNIKLLYGYARESFSIDEYRDCWELDEIDRNEAIRREKYVMAILERGVNKSTPQVLEPIIQDVYDRLQVDEGIDREIKNKPQPSHITVYRWLKKYKQSEGNIHSLVSSTSKKGNRTARIQPEVSSTIEQAISEIYLNPNQASAKDAHDRVIVLIVEENQRRKNLNLPELKIPNYMTTLRAVNDLVPRERDEKRLGIRTANLIHQAVSVGQGLNATRPLEIVVIDHSLLPFYVLDNEYRLALAKQAIQDIVAEALKETKAAKTSKQIIKFLGTGRGEHVIRSQEESLQISGQADRIDDIISTIDLPKISNINSGLSDFSSAFDNINKSVKNSAEGMPIILSELAPKQSNNSKMISPAIEAEQQLQITDQKATHKSKSNPKPDKNKAPSKKLDQDTPVNPETHAIMLSADSKSQENRSEDKVVSAIEEEAKNSGFESKGSIGLPKRKSRLR
jgi:hypothetical protein